MTVETLERVDFSKIDMGRACNHPVLTALRTAAVSLNTVPVVEYR
jgi:hypothetical protein